MLFCVALQLQDFVVIGVLFLLLGSGVAAVSRNGEETRRLRRLEEKVDLLLDKLGVVYQPTQSEDWQELARRGEKIAAIRALREQTGMGLAEAKEAVEKVERGGI